VKGHIVREPIELIDEDLEIIAGGDVSISVDVNVAVIDQLIQQIQVLNSGVTAAFAANAATVSLTT
jgi:hypothetical protein